MYEMPNCVKRGKKTSKEQVEMYVEFLEVHPTIAMARSNPNNDDLVSTLWEELAAKLNSTQHGPCKSVQQWQETFANWRYQLRFKARKISEFKEAGIGTYFELGRLEIRALKAFPESQTHDALAEEKTYKKPEPLADEGINKERRKKSSSSKRTRSCTAVIDRRDIKSMHHDDSVRHHIYEPPAYEEDEIKCEITWSEENDVKPNNAAIQSHISTLHIESSTQTNANDEGIQNPESAILRIKEIGAINKLETAVLTLNETLKTLVQVQIQILNVMNKR